MKVLPSSAPATKKKRGWILNILTVIKYIHTASLNILVTKIKLFATFWMKIGKSAHYSVSIFSLVAKVIYNTNTWYSSDHFKWISIMYQECCPSLNMTRKERQTERWSPLAARGQSCTSSVARRSTEMREKSGKVRLSSSWIDVHSRTLSLSPHSLVCFSRVASHFSRALWRRNSLPLPAGLTAALSAQIFTFKHDS